MSCAHYADIETPVNTAGVGADQISSFIRMYMGGDEHDVIEFMPLFSVQYHIASGRLQLEKLPYNGL